MEATLKKLMVDMKKQNIGCIFERFKLQYNV